MTIGNLNQEPSYAIGGASFTNKEWEKLMNKVDKTLEDVKEEQKKRFEKEQQHSFASALAQAAQDGAPVRDQLQSNSAAPYPYSHMAKDNEITYKDVTFFCDKRTNSINLGDVSDRKNTLVIPLSGGGCLNVNMDNLEELSKAIGMFSPEDQNRIMRAISMANKAKEAQLELEEDANSLGDSMDEKLEEA